MEKNIGVETKLLSIIGTDIGHSKSPAMMNAAAEKLGIDYYYFPMNVKETDFERVMKGISGMNFAGLTITIPYKIKVMQYLDEIDPLAEIIGAVNTIKISDGRMKGYNTDGEGFVRGLEADGGVNVYDSTFTVIGAGGVAKAITTVLASRKTAGTSERSNAGASAPGVSNAGRVYIANRTYSKAEELCEKLNRLVCDCCVPVRLDDGIGQYIEKSDVLINATNIGMAPMEDKMPVNPDFIPEGMLVADVIYNPEKTRLLEAAEGKKCRIINGKSLLLHQGKIAFKIWTDLEAPEKEMAEAVFGSSTK